MKRFALALIIFCSLFAINAASYSEKDLDCAKKLYDMGLFSGNGDAFSPQDADLDSQATRAQIAVTVTRMLGKENKAIYQQNTHPFSDVPSWASHYIGYLYESYLVNGTSDTTFGSNDKATVAQFATMLLRVLGYSDENGEDFTYQNAKDFALSKGLIDSQVHKKEILLRSDMVNMCYTALNLPIKNSYRTLGEKLHNEKVFSKEAAEKGGIRISNMLESAFADVPETLPKFTVQKTSATSFWLRFSGSVQSYGLRVFILNNETGVMKEVPNTFTDGYGLYVDTNRPNVYEATVTAPNIMGTYSFIVLKTSSYADIYEIYARSPVVTY